MSDPKDTIPYGFCHCGCGRKTAISLESDFKKNHRAGEPVRYISGHNFRNFQRSESHNAAIGAAQKKAWQTKRKRLPLGSTNINHDGYVVVKVVEGKGRWKPQHKIVAEQKTGQVIQFPQEVHHVNRVRHDNRPENLFVCRDKSHHNQVERSCDSLIAGLIADGIIEFDHETGEYRRS